MKKKSQYSEFCRIMNVCDIEDDSALDHNENTKILVKKVTEKFLQETWWLERVYFLLKSDIILLNQSDF